MKKITSKLLFTSFLTFVFGALYVSAQGLMIEVSLQQQIEKSSLVIEGEVISKKSFWDEGKNNIYTLNTIKVYKVFKGQVFKTIDVITLGGVVGLHAEIVTPSLNLTKSNIGVFTLEENSNIKLNSKSFKKQFKPYSSAQGFYEYSLYQNVASNPFKSLKGISTSFYDKIMSYTKKNYIDIAHFNVEEKQLLKARKVKGILIPSSITFSPSTISAGTKSVLTINGSGFGSIKGKVGFSESDEGGSSFINALDSQVLTWSNNQITVEVPSKAGSGPIRVTDNTNAFTNSSATLTVSYAELNIVSNQINAGPNAGVDIAFATKHVSGNGSGGYTWQMFTGFDTNASAKSSFLRAFDTWRCESGVNWVIGSTSSTNVISRDGVNIIRFDVGDELADNVLGRCTSHYSACRINGNESLEWYVIELDIVFNDNPDNTNSSSIETWNFTTNESTDNEFDFESVALHELGHGHQLDHVIEPVTDVMHYKLFNGENTRILGANNVIAANDVQTRSTSSGACGIPAMTNYSGDCGLNINDVNKVENEITLYPNPANKQLYIKSSFANLDQVVIYDVSGRLILDIDVSNTPETKIINLENTSKGMYFVNIYSENTFITKKLIVE